LMRKNAAAYLAGYFDADGCVSVSLNKSTLSVKVSISGRNKPLCERLKLIFHGSIETSPSGTLTWYAHSKNAHTFLMEMRDLVQYKEKQVGLALMVLDPEKEASVRLRAAYAICKLNQANLAKPLVTKTMTRILDALRSLGVEVVTNED